MHQTAAARYAPACATLEKHEVERIQQARMLVVGAGGIGCELLKDLVLAGVGHLDIVRIIRHRTHVVTNVRRLI